MNAPLIDSAYFLALFDEFNCVPLAKINAFLGLAAMQVGPKAWGNRAPYATALLAAHMLACSGGVGGSGGAAGGPLVSAANGAQSESYGSVAVPDSDSLYATTRYGQEYLRLRNSTIVGGRVTGGQPRPYYGNGEQGGAGWGDNGDGGVFG